MVTGPNMEYRIVTFKSIACSIFNKCKLKKTGLNDREEEEKKYSATLDKSNEMATQKSKRTQVPLYKFTSSL